MKSWIVSCAVLLLAPLTPLLSDTPRASMKTPKMAPNASSATIADIRDTLGIVPDMFKNYPEASLPGAWALFKNVQLNPKTAIPNKYKELLGLSVAAQIPCHYCTFFHGEAAKLNGATDREIQEAIALAAISRQWSTVFSGTMTDMGEFRSLVDALTMRINKQDPSAMNALKNVPTQPFDSAESALADIKAVFGTVPAFARNFPKEGIAGAWTEVRTLCMNPNTVIPSKYKNLISLGVSSQTPCPHCIYFDTQMAKLDGATDAEINEAIAMAAVTRHWSTVLNGQQTKEAVFKKQAAQIFAHVKKGAGKPAT